MKNIRIILLSMKSKKPSKENKFFQQKRTIYERITGFLPEAIILISGGTVKEIGKDGAISYRSTKIDEGDAFGILWGEARTLAVAELAMYFPQAVIIITSVSSPGKMTTIPAICEELEKLSVFRNRIILEKTSINTLSQIGETMKIIYEKEIKRVVFVTNEYHIPRIRAIYENFESLASPDRETKRVMQEIKCSGVHVRFVAAEIVLPYRDKKFIAIIDRMKKSLAYQKRVRNEERGLLMVKSGEYGKKKTASTDKSERLAQNINL